MPFDEAQKIVNESGESPDIIKCQEWFDFLNLFFFKLNKYYLKVL
jgi:hypothetical protein